MIRSIPAHLALAAAIGLAAGGGAQAAGVVISQVYGGGGNSGAPLHNDFIELFNAGTAPQSLSGWSVQYASAAGATWNNTTNLPDVTLQPGEYFLIEESAGSGGGDALPAPDASGAIAMSGTAGKVALVSSTTFLSGACPSSDPTLVDLVGYGSTASCSETAPTAGLSNSTAALRNDAGCADTGDNSADFSVDAPAPRNSATAPHPCTGEGGLTLSVADVSVTEGNSGTTPAVFTVTLSEPAEEDVTFDIATADGTATAGSDYVANALAAQTIPAGSTTYTFTVEVNGDTTPEPDETFKVNVTNVAGGGVVTTAASATGTIVNDDALHVYDIQGDGAHSPFLNATVTTSGEVTAIGGGGFYIQDAKGDGNPDTSDAVYVYTANNNPAGLTVGSVASVTGRVDEFYGLTEISNATVTFKPGKPTIQPFVLTDAIPSTDPAQPYCHGSLTPADGVQLGNFRCLQSMLVRVDDGVVSAPNFRSSSQPLSEFYAYVAGNPRPFRGPGLLYGTVIDNPPAGYDPEFWDGTPYVFGVDTGKLLTPAAMRSGMRFAATGIMGFDFGIGLLWPTSFEVTDQGPDYPITVPAGRPAANLTIGSQNMLRFFNDVADSGSIDTCANTNPGSSDVCPTPEQFQTRLSKLSLQVRQVLRAPAVVAAEEVENLATLQSLADQIHEDDPSLTYTAHLVEGNDVGGIDVGFLVRSDVTVNAVTQIGENTQTNDGCGSGTTCLLNDRPPLLLDATYGTLRFAVLAIHNRSLSGIEDPSDGPRIRAKRLEQAQYVAAIVQSWQTGGSYPLPDGDTVPGADAKVPLVIVGDYNAFEFSDGYVDVYGQIKGTAVQSENLVWAAPITNPPLRDDYLGFSTPATPPPYSFSYDGYAQELDHALVTEAARSRVVTVWSTHSNADIPAGGSEAADATTPLRSADHDGFVIELKGNPPASAGFASTVRKK